MSEPSRPAPGVPALARFVPVRGPWGLTGTDLSIIVFALATLFVMALSEGRYDVSHATLAALTAASWLPLFAVARRPIVVLAITVGVENLYLLLVPLLPPEQFNAIPVAVMVAAYSVGRRRPWPVAWLAGGAASACLLVVGQLVRASDQLAANMFALDLVLAATGAGVLIRSRHRRLVAMEHRAVAAEQTREEEARRRVTAERLRMARELHDVVAHNLALVNAQSSVAEYLLRSDPEAAAVALQDITRHTRQALDELRATVGLLRQADDPAGEDLRPARGLADLPELVAAHRGSGTAVTFGVEGDPQQLPALSDLAAYRIVQEALTNASKHAPGAWVHVHLRWSAGRLELWIDNGAHPGSGHGHRGPGTGHGLIGMGERAAAIGGTLTSGPRTDGGYTVAAMIPLDPDDVEKEQVPQ